MTALRLSLFSLLALGCSSPDDDSSRGARDTQAEVRQFLQRFSETVSSGNQRAIRGLYAPDGAVTWLEDGLRKYESVDAILAGFASFPPGSSVTTDFTDVEVLPIETDHAYVSALHSTSVSGGGTPDFRFSGAITFLLEHRAPRGWSILRGHSSSAAR